LRIARLISRLLPPVPTGPDEGALRDEWYVAVVRGVGALLTLPIIPLLSTLQSGIVYAAFVVALVCDAVILWLIIPRASWLLKGGRLTFLMDITSVSVVVYASGGVTSDFFVLYFVIPVAYALRFPRIEALFIAPVSMVWYAAAVILAASPAGVDLGVLLFRLLWIPIGSIFALIMAERARRAEFSLGNELIRTQALLEAAHAPAASLTLDGVLSAITQQVRALTPATVTGVRLNPEGESLDPDRERFAGSGGRAALHELLQPDSAALHTLLATRRPVSQTEIAAELPARSRGSRLTSFCAIEIPGDEGAQGVVVAATSGPQLLQGVHFEALSAFIARAALAIQNARLYEQLQLQVAELRSLHDQIVRSERLAAIGELAARVAHEVNNPLTTIHLYNSLLLEEPVDAEEQRRIATIVMEQVERAKRVVQDILDYSRPTEPHYENADLNVLVEKAVQLAWHAAVGGEFTLRAEYGVDLPRVSVDASQITQVFVNLAMNAIQAMSGGGTLLVKTGQTGDEVFARLVDNGRGIAPADLPHIFDPFFTTRATEHGTGLGLAVSRGLISKLRGRITVDSERGQGSTFTIWLPAETRDAALTSPVIDAPISAAQAST
jgi:signal transduction histidine kinase